MRIVDKDILLSMVSFYIDLSISLGLLRSVKLNAKPDNLSREPPDLNFPKEVYTLITSTRYYKNKFSPLYQKL